MIDSYNHDASGGRTNIRLASAIEASRKLSDEDFFRVVAQNVLNREGTATSAGKS